MADTLAGKLLVAMPGIGAPRFEHTVLVLCERADQPPVRVVVSKPNVAVTLGDFFDHLGLEAAGHITARSVLDGGPVRPDRGYVLHSEDFAAGEATTDIGPG